MYRLIKRQTILLSGAVHKMKHVKQIKLNEIHKYNAYINYHGHLQIIKR